tara:strand:- start:118 stop:237 length:120 start_codon:yes stop_codon:yes gene_type:complete
MIFGGDWQGKESQGNQLLARTFILLDGFRTNFSPLAGER